MAIETKTFPMKNPGVDNDPDWWSGPEALGGNEIGIVQGVVSQSPPNTTVKFIRKALRDHDREKVARYLSTDANGKALYDNAEWNALNAGGKANAARDWMQKLVKYLRLAVVLGLFVLPGCAVARDFGRGFASAASVEAVNVGLDALGSRVDGLEDLPRSAPPSLPETGGAGALGGVLALALAALARKYVINRRDS